MNSKIKFLQHKPRKPSGRLSIALAIGIILSLALTALAPVGAAASSNLGQNDITGPEAPDCHVDLGAEKWCEPRLDHQPPYPMWIEITNYPSGYAAYDVSIVDPLPDDMVLYGSGNFQFSSNDTSAAGSCSSSVVGGVTTITCDKTTRLNSNRWWRVDFEVDVKPGTPYNKPLVNTATVSTSTNEPDWFDTHSNVGSCSTHTPVTLAAFKASSLGDGTRFEWTTGAQYGTIGFNLFEMGEKGLQKINNELIPSRSVNSTQPQDYSIDISGVSASEFYLEEVSLVIGSSIHGPFKLGEVSGKRPVLDIIDWDAIRSEHDMKSQQRLSVQPAGFPESNLFLPLKVFLPLGAISMPGKVAVGNYPAFDLLVEQDGLYRVSYEDLQAAGLNLEGAPADYIALTNRGVPVPLYVQSGDTFGAGSFLEFYGKAADSTYTRTNIYTLHVDKGLAQRVAPDQEPFSDAQPAQFYLQTDTFEENEAYNFLSPNGDPWYYKLLLSRGGAQNWDLDMGVDHYLSDAAPAKLSVDLWGASDFDAAPDHHVIVRLNGVDLADESFDGLVANPIDLKLPTGALKDGANTLSFFAPADTGADWDITILNSYSVTYPRAFAARNGKLEFDARGDAFKVSNLPENQVVVYRQDKHGTSRLGNVMTQMEDQAYGAKFNGAGTKAHYLVYSVGALLSPAIVPAHPMTDITSGSAQFLMISHPDFIAGLAPLVQAREAQGYQVRVVSTEDVYQQFNYGIFDPQPIRDYIAHAAANMGTQYVLLVGADTYDYLDYLGMGSLSFVPSLYAQTGDLAKFAPVDPMYTDLDFDGTPDLPIGRFPVRSSHELSILIEKTLAYDNKDYAGSALFVADQFFSKDSTSFISMMPESWDMTFAYVDDLGRDAARATLLEAMNDGVALASFVGHSGPTRWTYLDLFNASDAQALANNGKPMVVTQWGCWNTYYVEPYYNTLAHKFLLYGDNGAAAVLGSTTLSFAHAERALGALMTPKLMQSGMTIGDAMQQAKEQMGARPEMVDVLLGWTILGDPTLVIHP